MCSFNLAASCYVLVLQAWGFISDPKLGGSQGREVKMKIQYNLHFTSITYEGYKEKINGHTETVFQDSNGSFFYATLNFKEAYYSYSATG
jgi:hypothetical protein